MADGASARKGRDELVEILRAGLEEIAAKRAVAAAERSRRRATLRIVDGGRRKVA